METIMTTATAKEKTTLAIDGGPQAFGKMNGKAQPKVGVEEFLSLAERFAFKPDAICRLRAAVTDDDIAGDGHGAHLGRYYGSAKPSKGEQFEALAREKIPAQMRAV